MLSCFYEELTLKILAVQLWLIIVTKAAAGQLYLFGYQFIGAW
jgi:hypothetical protein